MACLANRDVGPCQRNLVTGQIERRDRFGLRVDFPSGCSTAVGSNDQQISARKQLSLGKLVRDLNRVRAAGGELAGNDRSRSDGDR